MVASVGGYPNSGHLDHQRHAHSLEHGPGERRKAQRSWFHIPGYYFVGIKLVVLQSQNNSCLLQTKRRVLKTGAEQIVGREWRARVS